MNSTFKVVFNKARGALMVVNEVTSSVQAKGTKTVVATAVAAALAGVAGVAGAADAVFGTEGVLTITAGASTPTVEATNVKNGTGSTATAYTAADLADNMVVAFNADGKSVLNLTATKDNAVTRTVANITKSGTINMTSNTEGNKTATLKVGAAEAATGVSIAGHNQTLTFNFANSGAGTNKPESVLSTANANAALTLGTSDATGHDFDGAVALNVAKDAYAKVMGGSAGAADLTLENVKLTNAGQITFKGANINVNSAYDGTADGNTGKVIFDGATVLTKAVADGVIVVGTKDNLGEDVQKAIDTHFTFTLQVTGEKAALKADTLYVTNALTLGTEYNSTGPVPSQAGSVEAATVAYVGDGTAGSVVVGSHSTFDAAKLVLNKGSIEVKAHAAGTEHAKAHAGVLSAEELTVVAGTENTITNAGKVSFDKVTVAGVESSSEKKGVLGITNTAGGKASLGEVTLSGVGSNTGTLTLKGVLTTLDVEDPVYDFEMTSVDIQKAGALKLDTAGVAHVAGDMTIAAGGSFTDAANTILVVDKAFTANDNVTIAGKATVGSVNLVKDKTLTATANGLTISGTGDSVNAGKIVATGKDVVINGGKFTNEKVGTETAESNLNAANLQLSKTEFENNGLITLTGTLSLDKGSSFSTEVAGLADGATVTVGEDSVLNIKALNLKSSAEAADYDVLNLTHAIELAQGGSITLKGASLQDVDVRAASLTVGDKSSFESKSLTVGDALSVDGGAVAVTTLEQGASATVDVSAGVLKADKFWQNASASDLTVGLDGELQLTAEGIGLVIAADNSFTDFTVQTGSKKFNGVTANSNAGTIVVTGLDGQTITETGLTTLAGKLGTSATSTGILDLGGLKVKDLAATDGKIGYDKIDGLNGVALDYLKDVTVTKVNGQLQGVYGAAQMSGASTDLSVTKTLVLTGNGDIVTAPTSATDPTLEVANVVLGASGVTNTSLFTYRGQAEGSATVGNITADDNETAEKLVFVESGNLNAGNVTVDGVYVDGALTTKNLTVDEAVVDGALTVNGNASVTELDVAGDMTVGKYIYEATGEEVNGDLSVTTTTEVVGSLTALGNVTFTGGADIAGTANLGKVSGDIAVGSADPEDSYNGTLFVNEFVTGTITVDPAWDENGVVALGDESRAYVNKVDAAGTIHGAQASLTVLGTHDVDEVNAALEQAGFTQFQKEDGYAAVLYINGAAEVAGNVLVNGVEAAGLVTGIVATAEDADEETAATLTVINGASFGEEAVTEGDVSLNDVFVANAAVGQAIKLTSGALDIEGDVKVSSGRILEAVAVEGTIGVDVKSDDDLGALALVSTIDTLKSYYVNGQNLNETKSKSALFNEFMMQEENGTKGQLQTAAIIEDVAAIGATAGMASVTMDALSAFNDTVAQRTSILAPNAEGVTVWADVNGGRYQAKKLMDGAGYASDIYAGVLGVDTTVACGAKIGAAITVGTGDTDSKNTVAETSMDSDFFGVSIYTAKQFGVANVAIDLGYMQGSNDVDVKAFNLGKFSADSDAFTIGVRGELLTKAGDFNIVPHAGLRWTRISVDSFEAGYDTDIDSMNVFQLPVGVTVSGEFEGAGFTWAPAFDLSFVPAFGDKDAEMTLGIRGANAQTSKLGVQVIDSNPVQATLGIDATNGAWAFGLNYKLGVGTDSRMNNSFNANVRYTF